MEPEPWKKIGWPERHFRQAIGARVIEEKVEHIEPAELIFSVNTACPSSIAQLLLAAARLFEKTLSLAELNAVGRTHFRACRLHVRCHPIVAEGALGGCSRSGIDMDHVEGTGRHAMLIPVADMFVDENEALFVPVDGLRWTGFEARRVRAMLAGVAHKKPKRIPLLICGLDEFHLFPSLAGELGRILICSLLDGRFGRQIVPLLAGDLTGPAADAKREIKEHIFRHDSARQSKVVQRHIFKVAGYTIRDTGLS